MAGLMRETLAQEARDDLAAILAETAKSSNLKGTVVKAIKEAVRKVEGAVNFLHRGETATEAARRMSEDNRRMRGAARCSGNGDEGPEGGLLRCYGQGQGTGGPTAVQLRGDARGSEGGHRRSQAGHLLLDEEYDRRPPRGHRKTPPCGVPAPPPGRQNRGTPEATPAVTAVAPRLLPSAAASESTPGPSLARNAPAGQRPSKKAKRKAPPRKVVGRKARKAKTAAAAPQAARAPAKAAPKTAPRPRALATPRSSAVVITLRPEAVAEKGATYKVVLEAATAAVDLGSLGIPHVRVRNTQTGARIVEVPGATSAEKADTLAAKLEEAIGGLATVTRPTKTADLRVTGFDESVTPEKIRAVVAAKGQCPQSAVSVGAVRLAPNGRGSALVRCPVTAAQRVAAAGRILVGWSSAGVHVMEPLPMRCFRCMGIGHTRALCPSSVDRSGLCFRCGQVGHSASGCTATPRCSVCTAARRPADHVMGGRSCAPSPTKGKSAGTTGPPLLRDKVWSSNASTPPYYTAG
ncbi:uncharacterized protein LOC113237981 [Hyposmocoma kahamanoa]|uniref:uncharacterized protein LOC113237981 n=1 Tax=Hyposmocoma kahamanoa TaxID=1477025 RepID=UPI000E6D7502|nr:uncharacterized protein LOC113237981 [Hyposmocoma kahamanoa]